MGMVQAGEAGLTSVVEGMAKMREAVPDSIREAADRRLGGDSALGKGVLAMVDTVAEESAKAKVAKAAVAAEAAAIAKRHAAALAESAESAAQEVRGGRGRAGKLVIGGLAVTAAAGGAYFVWKRRQASAQAHLSGEEEWGTAPAAAAKVPEFTPGMADVQSPDVVDEEFAHEVDEAADELAAEVVEAIEVPGDAAHDHVQDAPEPAEPFVPGVADEQSPDVVDDGFAAQVDSAADDIAGAVVDAIESPEGKHK